MTLNQLSRILYKSNQLVRDANAIKRGRIVQRTENKILGRLVSKAMRGVWK